MNNQKLLEQAVNDPHLFIKMCWPDMKLTEYQSEIIRSLVESNETFVHAANGVGKTRIAALIAIWFYLTRTPARVIITSSSEHQLTKILWKEIRMLISSSKIPFPLEFLQLEIQKDLGPNDQIDQRDGLYGMVPRSVESFQGYHLPKDRSRVLLLIDEASGVPDEFYEAGKTWADAMLVIGNPMKIDGFFFRQCKSGNQEDPFEEGKLFRRVMHVSAVDSPNVQYGLRMRREGKLGRPKQLIDGIISFEKYLRLENELDGPQRTIRLLGQFYEGEHSRLFPDSWLDLAMDCRRWQELQCMDRRPIAMGIDVAAGGRDKTCWTLVDEHGIIEQIVDDIEDSMKIAGRTRVLMDQYGLSSATVSIDVGGGGKQIADRLAEQGRHINRVNFGESATVKGTYINRRAELFGTLRDKLKPETDKSLFSIPPDAHELRTDLAVLPLDYDSEGRLQLLRKRSTKPGDDSIEKRLRRSPDRADSLVLAVWSLSKPRFSQFNPGYREHTSYQGPQSWVTDPPPTKEDILSMPDGYKEMYMGAIDYLYPGLLDEYGL